MAKGKVLSERSDGGESQSSPLISVEKFVAHRNIPAGVRAVLLQRDRGKWATEQEWELVLQTALD